MNKVACILFALLISAPILRAADAPISYSKDIRPILSENCFYCHGQDANKRKSDLRLDTQDGQRSKKAIIPGQPDQSELIKRIFTDDEDDHMPPAKSNRHLSADQKALIKRWVAQGAPFEGHWAYVAPKRPALPNVDAKNPIDKFVIARLQHDKLQQSSEASKQSLIRRLTLDVTGLPPTPAEVDAFVNDPAPDAYEKLVDRLFASPHYGEKMALPWLDAARYADSNGFQQDGDTFQWIWRDWVVKALNDNMRFDQFTIEQLAGDLLPNATQDQKIATAFNRNHLLNGEGGAIPEEQRYVVLFDRVDVTATNWLGLTMACAQCHDHKYDPITAKDYYAFMSAFNNVPENGVVPGSSSRFRIAEPFIEIVSAEQKTKLAALEKSLKEIRADIDRQQKEWETKTAADDAHADKAILKTLRDKDPKGKPERDRAIKKHFDEKIAPTLPGKPLDKFKAAEKKVNDLKSDYPRVMVMSDSRPRETHILDRGAYETKKEKVTFATPSFLPAMPADAPRNRLGLARWLVNAEQPLTARVAVNRLWQNFFGMGLVKTAEDFGVQSESPIHQELLDWLAVEFRESGWDMKHINRLIVTSQTYKQSSKVSPELLQRDPENRLFARAPRFRLPSMVLRDIALSTAGLIDTRVGGKPVYPYQPEGIWETLAITKERDFTYPQSTGPDLYRRSLYTFWRRTVGPANMFDAANRQTCRVRNGTTNTPLHALTTLNDVTWVEAARVLAEKSMQSAPDINDRFNWIVQKVIARQPTEKERIVLKRMYDKQHAIYHADPAAAKKLISAGPAMRDEKLNPTDHAAMTAVCLAIFNLDEALSRE